MFYENEGATVEVGGKAYHSYRDMGMILSEQKIGTPKQRTSYVDVPGMNGRLDLSEELAGRPTYTGREISVTFEDVRTDRTWDHVVSNFRNIFDGRIVKVIFDNDKEHYWTGRCSVADFERNWNLGKFVLSIPDADPYKYNVDDSTQAWRWDPFSFVDGVIEPRISDVAVDGTAEYLIPRGQMPTVPDIMAVLGAGQYMQASFHGRTFDLVNGMNRFPSIVINGDTEETISFTGHGRVTVQYRGGSL